MSVPGRVYQQGCSRVRFPAALDASPPEAILINTAGGLTDGDRLRAEFDWAAGTTATVTTQAAERIYRSRHGPARIETRLSVAAGASAFWLPQETILFDGGRLSRRTEVELAPGGRLLAVESLVIGRPAMGERVRRGDVADSWRVRVGGRLVFADNFRLHDDDAPLDALLARPAVAGAAGALATLVLVADDAEARRDALRPGLRDLGCTAAATCLDGLLLLRLLAADSRSLRGALAALIVELKSGMDATGGALPRVWHC